MATVLHEGVVCHAFEVLSELHVMVRRPSTSALHVRIVVQRHMLGAGDIQSGTGELPTSYQ